MWKTLFIAFGAILLLILAAPTSFASCAAPANSIEAENCNRGMHDDDWLVQDGATSENTTGFATDISVNRGETIHFKIRSKTSYILRIFRLGYYDTAGARLMTTLSGPATPQPPCFFDPDTKLQDCGNWSESLSWNVPSNAVSGIYIMRLSGQDGAENQSVFLVRDDASQSDILMVTVDTTWDAYNFWSDGRGDISLYRPRNGSGRAFKVSYNRPFKLVETGIQTPYDHEYPLIRWVEDNAYDITYMSHVDMIRHPELLKNHKMILMSGHDEYYSPEERSALVAARDAGIHLAMLTANNIAWKTRWEPGLDGRPFGNMVCWKESTLETTRDPQDPPTWTGSWTDPPSWPTDLPKSLPANGVTGQLSAMGPYHIDPMTVLAADGKMRFWRNTSIAQLAPGTSFTFPQMLGYEWDSEVQNAVRPLSLFHLSDTTINRFGFDFRHNMSIYKAKSGALVWGTGTMQWSWALDHYHFSGQRLPPNKDVEQATVNMFADMGVQPHKLRPYLQAATPSTDTLAPICTVTTASPMPVSAGQTAVISGTAVDYGGGVVGGVVVSFDGGKTYWKAEGRENWTITHTFPSADTLKLKCLAVDDSGNLEGREPGIRPPALTNLTGFPGNQSVTLRWDFAPGTVFKIYYATHPVAPGPDAVVVSTNTNLAKIFPLQNGTSYYFVVTIIARLQESPPSNMVGPLVPGAPPAPPAAAPNPGPLLTHLDPDSVRPGTSDFTLTLLGNGFVFGSQVLWNGAPRKTFYLSPIRLQATIPSSDVTQELTAQVSVFSPSPGGGNSGSLPFVVSETANPNGVARAFPNPWKSTKNPPPFMTFDNLTPGSQVKIFTLSAHWIRTLDALNGVATWDLNNDAGQPVASGYYLYVATDMDGRQVRDKVAIIR